MNVFTSPDIFKPDGKFTIFLAGSIEMGRAENWQTEFCNTFRQYDVNVLNPRRHNWDASWEQSIRNPTFRLQVEWELKGLRQADLILMYLQPDTLSPISLMEYGLFADSGKIVVCCPNGFWRKGNIDIVSELHPIISCESKQEFFTIATNIIERKC